VKNSNGQVRRSKEENRLNLYDYRLKEDTVSLFVSWTAESAEISRPSLRMEGMT
jgi:hypothetical protein